MDSGSRVAGATPDAWLAELAELDLQALEAACGPGNREPLSVEQQARQQELRSRLNADPSAVPAYQAAREAEAQRRQAVDMVKEAERPAIEEYESVLRLEHARQHGLGLTLVERRLLEKYRVVPGRTARRAVRPRPRSLATRRSRRTAIRRRARAPSRKPDGEPDELAAAPSGGAA